MDPIVSVRGIVNRFGRQVVHDGLDVDIRAGEVFGIVGGSGSAISCCCAPCLSPEAASGSVRIEGQEVTAQSERDCSQSSGGTA